MTDFLLVHGAGQGAWVWGRVWGYLTAPVEHPPRLYIPRSSDKVYPMDLPGHGADAGGDTGDVIYDECVHAVLRAVEREELEDVVLVGHGTAGPIVLQAASQLPSPPKRVVLVGGVLPDNRKNMVSVFPYSIRRGFYALSLLSKLTGRDLRVPRPVIRRYLLNGMDPMKVVQVIGFFGPLPSRVLTTRIALDDVKAPCPVTYVVLTEDRLLTPEQQRGMAGRLSGAEIIELASNHEAPLHRPRELADILLKYAQVQ